MPMTLVTLDKLTLGPSRSEANAVRVKNGRSASDMASFYDLEECDLGEGRDVASWFGGGSKDNNVKAYKYTRLSQQGNDGSDGTGGGPVYLCGNFRSCSLAKGDVPFRATKTLAASNVGGDDPNAKKREAVVIDAICPECGSSQANLRARANRRS